MSDSEKETAFLRHILLVHDTDEGRQLDKKMVKAQCEERCVLRFASLAVMCGGLAVAGLGYTAILADSIPFGTSEFVKAVLRPLALASLICLVVFLFELASYRKKLSRLQQESRQLFIRLQAPHVIDPGHSDIKAEAGEVPQAGSEPKDPTDRLDSLRRAVAQPERNTT